MALKGLKNQMRISKSSFFNVEVGSNHNKWKWVEFYARKNTNSVSYFIRSYHFGQHEEEKCKSFVNSMFDTDPN